MRAREILESGLYSDEVREREQLMSGRASTPCRPIVNDKIVQGGQPAEVFEQALRKIADESRQSALRNSEALKP